MGSREEEERKMGREENQEPVGPATLRSQQEKSPSVKERRQSWGGGRREQVTDAKEGGGHLMPKDGSSA